VRTLLALIAVAAAACDDPKPRCPAGFIGDPSKPTEATMLISDGTSGTENPIAPHDPLPLEPPPQGGYVSYVGTAARNLDGCGVELRGTLRDPDTGAQLGFDARTTDLVRGADGWGRSNAANNANLSNVNICPDYSSKDRQGQEFILELQVVDRGHRTATVSMPVVPTCNLTNPLVQADCLCTCSANYFLGKCNPSRLVDGAVSD
jgi:hypothetical protein